MEFVLTESEHQKKLKAEEERKAEEARLAAEKKKAQQRASLTVKVPTSVSSYGQVTKLYRDASSRYGSCVSFAKAQTGIYRSIGNGARAGIQGSEPKVGAIVALKGRIHAGVVTGVTDSTIIFKESGWVDGWITQRELPKSQAIGYIYY